LTWRGKELGSVRMLGNRERRESLSVLLRGAEAGCPELPGVRGSLERGEV
jgi:hypothetical protein